MPRTAFNSVKRFGRCFMGYKDALFWHSMRNFKNLSVTSLVVIAAASLNLAWLYAFAAPLIIVAFAALERIAKKSTRPFWTLYLVFGLWNAGTTYWIANAHPLGVVATVGVNSALMALALWWGVRSEQMLLRFPSFERIHFLRYLPIIAAWIAFEQLHENWALSFPWLNLGNTFYGLPSLVQWYQITGAVGGTVWVLVVSQMIVKEATRRQLILTLTGPMLASVFVFYLSTSEQDTTIKVAVVQPNIDAYVDKWELPERVQIQKVERLLSTSLGEDTVDLLVLPETFLPKAREEGTFGKSASDAQFQQLQRRYAKSTLFGATTYDFQDEPNLVNRPYGSKFYTIYNTALFAQGTRAVEYYHKGKLVVGAETMPFIQTLKPILGDWSVSLGGTSGTLGVSTQRKVFEADDLDLKLAPIICWENEFSNYATAYSRQGANLLAVITNDGWWGNTPGHIQHLHFSGLRAIEQGKYVVRSANTGVSAVIDHKGRILTSLGWEEEGVLVAKVPLRENRTIYVRTGNLLGPFFVALFALFASVVLLSRFFRLKQ